MSAASPALLRLEERAKAILMECLSGSISIGEYVDKVRTMAKEEGCTGEVDWSKFDGLENVPAP